MLRGEDLDSLSRELGVTAAAIAGWRDLFLASGQAGLRSRDSDERDQEVARMKIKIGDMTMENELLRERARRAEANHHFVSRRSRPVSQICSSSAGVQHGLGLHLLGARDPRA